MFQNISNEEEINDIEDVELEKRDRRIQRLKELFSIQNIVLYAIACMASMVSFNGSLAPFGLAIFAAVCGNRIAAGVVYVVCLIGVLIGFGGAGFLTYLLTTLIFIVMILVVKPRYQEEGRNEKQKLGVHIFAATLLVRTSFYVFRWGFMERSSYNIYACYNDIHFL
ncbi:MAG: hypothetical protein FWC79_08555 [Oscillospiraceae bacterium]|nr:hypothetical protein [Oscillospiraceae bacterium]